MIDGYAIVDGETQAVVVVDDVITKRDLIEWGWARGPVKILGQPEKHNPRAEAYPFVFTKIKEAEKAVKDKQAFELDGGYYALSPIGESRNHGSSGELLPTQPYRDSPWESFYWVNGNWKEVAWAVISDSNFKFVNALPRSNTQNNPAAIELITAALSAPVVDGEERVPYYGQWVTSGGEEIPITLWSSPKYTDENAIDVILERGAIPGVGYHYPVAEVRKSGRWPDEVIRRADNNSFSFSVNFPNCEIGPNFCVKFTFDRDETLYYERSDRQFLWTSITARYVYYPDHVRRIPMPRFQPRSATDAVSCYVMDRQSVKAFIAKLYTKDIYDKVKAMLYGDGAGNLLSLKWFYGVRPAITTPQKRKITLGNVIFNDLTVPVFAGDFTQVYMGYCFVGRTFSDYRDYTNVRIQAYIPMVGLIDLEPSKVTGTFVHLFYTINLTDGSAIVTLSTSSNTPQKTNGWYEIDNIIFTTSITYGYEIPLNVESIRSPALMVGEIATKAVAGGAIGAIAGNVPGAVLGALGGAAAATNQIESTYSVGSLTPNSNVMGDFTPKIYRIFNEDASGNISEAVGKPSGVIVKVGEASGYLKAAMVYGTPSSTMHHTDEIINILKEGIYIS